jgi:hypothetical protein
LEAAATDGKTYKTRFYNLDAIIAVGYRVNSYQATQFRTWATKTLREFIVKGFVLDDERLKQGKTVFGKDYFDELLERIRVGLFLSGLLVGGGRARRGERLAGRAALAGAARRLLVLIARHVPAEGAPPVELDPFDPHRRFERAYPAIAEKIHRALGLGGPSGAAQLLEIAARELALIPQEAAAAIRSRLAG